MYCMHNSTCIAKSAHYGDFTSANNIPGRSMGRYVAMLWHGKALYGDDRQDTHIHAICPLYGDDTNIQQNKTAAQGYDPFLET